MIKSMEPVVTDINSPVFRYLPATLLSNWAASPDQGPIWGEWLQGSLMHCDVTGFTAMNEALASMGHEGAEVMARILNQFFERMLRIGENWNGIQMKFGGDAMLLYFPNEQHAICAAKCGLEMQSAMKEFSKVQVNDGVCQLRMRIGIHSGRFYSASIGNDKGLLHYLLTGSDVNRAADVEPMAEPGQVVVSDETAQLLKDHSRLSPTDHLGIWEVKRVDPIKITRLNLHITNVPHEILSRYLIPAIAEGKGSNLLGEHRRATIAFIYLFGLSELLQEKGDTETLRQANEYMKLVFTIADKYNGSLLTSDVAEHADKIVVAFGIPVSSDDQESNCLRFSFELNEKLGHSKLCLKHQIGINTGFLFAGEIGSSWRREYTTIGDNMNLAARLMAAAGEGNILVSSATADKVGSGFEFETLEPIRVKGKSQPIKISRLISATDFHETIIQPRETLFIGRDSEIASLRNLAVEATSTGPVSALISGDPGIGKTSLCEALLLRLQNNSWQTTHSICQSYNSRSVFSAWKYPLIKLFGISASDSASEVWSAIKAGMLRYCPDMAVFAPLVADILAISHQSNAVVDSLDAKTKREKRMATVVTLLVNMAKDKPICMVFDNANWMDYSSAELAKRILDYNGAKILMVFASRGKEIPDVLLTNDRELNISLGPLSKEASREFVLEISDLDEHMSNIIVEKAGGNPLFIKELIGSGTLNENALPDSIYDVVMIKLDRLERAKRSALRKAAVIGQVFDLNILASITRDS